MITRAVNGWVLAHLFRRLSTDTSGTVAVIAALALPIMVGFASLAVEFGHAQLLHSQVQRTADLAVLAAATNYASTASLPQAMATANNVGVLNGLASGTASTSLTTSPRTTGATAIMVKFTATQSLTFAPILGFPRSFPVSAISYAEVGAPVVGCLIALNPSGAGISLSGGTSLSAPSCNVASNASEDVPCGTTIAAKSITYGTSAPSQPCGGITGAVSSGTTADPLASSPGVTAATARLATVQSLSAPSAPVVPTGTDVSFGYDGSAFNAVRTVGCSASFSSPNWTVTCPRSGVYLFGSITLQGGIGVLFDVNGSGSTYDFSGLVSNTGGALQFGNGTFNLAKGLYTGGGTRTTFGSGTFNVGPSPQSCNGATYSVCNTGTSLTFAGPSTFALSSGAYDAGGSTLTFGSGSENTIAFGAGSDGNALLVGGGATTTLGDTGSNAFRLTGNFTQGGGACTSFGAAAQHDLKGSVNTAGGTTLGAGAYTITGYFAAGGNGGGDVGCGGTQVGVSAVNVTITLGGAQTYPNGSCAKTVLCLGSGFSHVTLTAPTTGTLASLAIIGPTDSGSAAGAAINEGSSATDVGGAIYFPHGPVSLSGGAALTVDPGQCLAILASQMTLSGGTKVTASGCSAETSGSGSNKVRIVQ